jgi:hypothetical protein
MCPDKGILSAFIDNEVEGKFYKIVKQHVDFCEKCKDTVNAFVSLRTFFKEELKEADAAGAQERVWNSVNAAVTKAAFGDIWHKKVLIPFPAMAAASAFIIFFAVLSFYFLLYDGKYYNNQINMSESAIVDREEDLTTFENDHVLDVDLQLPETAIFTISGSPRLIREIDYNSGGSK